MRIAHIETTTKKYYSAKKMITIVRESRFLLDFFSRLGIVKMLCVIKLILRKYKIHVTNV